MLAMRINHFTHTPPRPTVSCWVMNAMHSAHPSTNQSTHPFLALVRERDGLVVALDGLVHLVLVQVRVPLEVQLQAVCVIMWDYVVYLFISGESRRMGASIGCPFVDFE